MCAGWLDSTRYVLDRMNNLVTETPEGPTIFRSNFAKSSCLSEVQVEHPVHLLCVLSTSGRLQCTDSPCIICYSDMHTESIAASCSQTPRLTTIKHPGPSMQFTCACNCSFTIIIVTGLIALRSESPLPGNNDCESCNACQFDCLDCLPSESQ